MLLVVGLAIIHFHGWKMEASQNGIFINSTWKGELSSIFLMSLSYRMVSQEGPNFYFRVGGDIVIILKM